MLAEDLRTVEVFRVVPAPVLDRVAEVARELRHKAGDVVALAGGSADTVLAVQRGMVALFVPLRDGTLLPCEVLGPGKVIGLSAFVGRRQYNLTSMCLIDSALDRHPREGDPRPPSLEPRPERTRS